MLNTFLTPWGSITSTQLIGQEFVFCELTFDWHYQEGYVDVSMPGYIKEVLKRLQHTRSKRIQYSPHEYLPIYYGKYNATQYASSTDTLPTLPITDTRYIQSVVGSFIYYGRAINGAILPTQSTLT